jgi:CheY-like chemotaxis protein
MKILIADDIPTNRKLLRVTLEAEGHEIFEACDGEEALQVLARETIDSVISDILMPNMDGFRLCREVRSDKALQALPFLVYTSTYTSPSDQELAQTVGADVYLVKPAPAHVLIQALEEASRKASKRARNAVTDQPDENYILKKYSEALVKKLEEKNDELQRSLEALQRAHDRIVELNNNLERRVQERTAELQGALKDVKTLSGLLPICCYCKKIRDEKNYWQEVESYISKRTATKFSHGYCPDCYEKVVKPQLDEI